MHDKIKKPKKLFFLNKLKQFAGSSILKFFICKKKHIKNWN